MIRSFRQLYSVKQPFTQSDEFYRLLIGVGALTYLFWWKTVEIYLAGSFNPIGSRLAVVFFCAAVFLATFLFPRLLKHARVMLSVCVWIIVRWLNRSIETSRWFQDLSDSVFEGIVVHDRGKILHANGAFEAFWLRRRNRLNDVGCRFYRSGTARSGPGRGQTVRSPD